MKKLIFVVLIVVILSALALTVWADEPPRHHWHYVTLSSGKVVEVGPDVCKIPMNDTGWHKFHSNMHRGIPGDILEISIEFCPE